MLSLAIALTLAHSSAPSPDDWWSVQARVVSELEQRDVGAWSRELVAQPMPEELPGLLERLQVTARAGHEARLEQVLAALADLSPELQRSELRSLPQFFIERGDLAHARLVYERLAHVTPTAADGLLRAWSAEVGPDDIDTWLRERWARSPEWTHVWLGYRRELGTAEEVIDLLEAELRAAPGDLAIFERYVDAQRMAGQPDVALDWLAEVARPEGALAQHQAGQALARRWPSAARPFLERALELPLSETEAREIELRLSIPIASLPGSPTAAMLFRGWCLRSLMEVHQRLGDAARAQELLEELAKLAPDGLPLASLEAAGSIQGLSGARVIEGRVLAAEEERREDMSYWLGRASYYEGRGERGQERKALVEARRVAVGEGVFAQGQARDRYARFLAHTEDSEAALSFLLQELRLAEPGGDAAAGIVDCLLHHKDDRSSQPDPGLGIFWTHLGARGQWGHNERQLLLAMERKLDRRVGHAEPPAEAGREALWARAEALARGGDVTRAAVLGEVLIASAEVARALPWLAAALARMPAGREAQAVAAQLYRARLEVGDWRGAEEVEPRTRGYLTPVETVERLGRLALCAASGGEPAQALRIWKRRANLDRGALQGLEELSDRGLREGLVEFYAGLVEQEPECAAASRALARLR